MSRNRRKPKLVLLFGPPAAGKSTFISHLEKSDFKHSTPDDIFERMVKEAFIDTGMADSINDAFQKFPDRIFPSYAIRGEAVAAARDRLDRWLAAGENVVIEGTGGDPFWYYHNIMSPLEDRYDILIMMVYAELETCLERNEVRGRLGGRNLPNRLVESLRDGFIWGYGEFSKMADRNGYTFLTVSDTPPYDLGDVPYVSVSEGLLEMDSFLKGRRGGPRYNPLAQMPDMRYFEEDLWI